MKDRAGLSLAYVYFEEERGRRAAAKLLTRDEARRVAVNIARLPRLISSACSYCAPSVIRLAAVRLAGR